MVAVGEIGLDYRWLDACPKERQQEVFAAQLELAQELALPVVVHDREAHGDTVEFLRKYRPRGVVHCFSGSWETAREILGLGMYIGLGGVVTFKNARHAVEVAQNHPPGPAAAGDGRPLHGPCSPPGQAERLLPHPPGGGEDWGAAGPGGPGGAGHHRGKRRAAVWLGLSRGDFGKGIGHNGTEQVWRCHHL